MPNIPVKTTRIIKKYIPVFFRILGITLLSLILLLGILILLIRTPWGQQFIFNKAVNIVSSKTGATMNLDKLFITFQGNLYLEGLYIEDQKADTLLYVGALETGVSLWPLIQTGEINVSKLTAEKFRGNVLRDSISQKFNYEFLIDPFLSAEEEEKVIDEKPESSGFPNISLGPIHLKDFQAKYQDDLMGLDAKAAWQILNLDFEHFDLNGMNFSVQQFLLSNSEVRFIQSKPFPESEEEPEPSDLPLPLLVLDQLDIENLNFHYASIPDGMEAKGEIGKFDLALPEANLESQKILLKSFALENSFIDLHLRSSTEAEKTESQNTSEELPFHWPDWWVEVGAISLADNSFSYRLDEHVSKSGIFNPDAIEISGFDLAISQLFLKEKKAGLNVENILFREFSGLELRKLTGKIELSDQSLNVSNFDLRTADSRLSAELALSYPDLWRFIDDPLIANFSLDLKSFISNGREALYFSPELAKDLYFKEFQKQGLQAKGSLAGNTDRLELKGWQVDYGKETFLSLPEAKINSWQEIEDLQADIPEFSLKSKGKVWMPFLSEMEIELPEVFDLKAKFNGGMDKARANLTFNSTDGNAEMDFLFALGDAFDLAGQLETKSLDIGKIIGMAELSPLTFQASINAEGTDFWDTKGMAFLCVEELIYEDLDLSNLEMDLSLDSGKAAMKMGFEKDFLAFDLSAGGQLDSLNSEIEFLLDMNRLMLRDLGLSKEVIEGRFELIGEFSGNPNAFKSNLSLENTYLLKDQQSFPVGPVRIDVENQEQSSSLKVAADFLRGEFGADADFESLIGAISQYFDAFLNADEIDSLEIRPVNAKGNFKFKTTPFIDQVLISGIDHMDTLHFDFVFATSPSNFQSKLFLNDLTYSDAQLDSLSITFDGNQDAFTAELGFKELLYGPLDMDESQILMNLKTDTLGINMKFMQEDRIGIYIGSELVFNGDSLKFHVFPDDLTFNKKSWNIPDDNAIYLADGILSFHDFEFFRNGESLAISNQLKETEEYHIGIRFKNFALETFTSFLNPEEPPAKGLANGDLILINPFDALGLLATLKVSDLEAVGLGLGNLDLNASSNSYNDYNFDLSLAGAEIDLVLNGSFETDTISSKLDLNLDLKALQMSLIESFSVGEIRNSDGFISGKLNLGGTVKEPKYTGVLTFNQVGFVATQLGTRFSLPDERIKVDNEGLYFEQFRVQDADRNSFVIDGLVNTTEITDPKFDIKLTSRDFQVINSTREDSDLFFGKAILDLDMDVRGTLALPVVRVRLNVKRGSEMSFIVPQSQLDLVERSGVYIFVNHQDPDDLIYKRSEDFSTTGLLGYDVTANLKIDGGTIFNVIVDERTGDNLRLQGEADLNMLMNPNGDISISGRYLVQSGHYELNLFGLVNRRFELASGSSVVWNGDPIDAILNIQAIYNVRTSAAELMQAQLTGSDAESRGQFRQVLPFMVYLNINGELLKPEISFELDMGEQERGAFGGSVYGMIQQINEQEDALIKQVFSLLVLNQFFPVMGNDGSTGGSVNLARSSVSQVLSSQLNAFSDRLFGDSGFSVDFALDSFTDFQSGAPEDRTQLNVAAKQRLMDDRLIISVGGQVNVEGGNQQADQQGDALFGDVSLEYLLDERGQWRAKAYRKNQFESVIDGELIITGVSLIFNKEFNAFKELFTKMKPEQFVIPTEAELDELEEKMNEQETNKEEVKDE